ncbi:MAG: hypothetical protein ACXADH_03905 [Candidatus Kariarchaeaceae archaeon]|jgi:hypothetical protein
MAMVDGDWTIQRSTGNIRYIGDDHGGASPTYATVIQFHRWLQDFADQEVSSGDDELDITDPTPSERSTDNIITLKNGFNITNGESEHLYDGSIIQGTGGTEAYWDGIVNYGNSDVQIQIVQDGAVLSDDWWNFGGGGLNADTANGISHRFMVPTRDTGADIDGRRLIGTSRTFGNTYSEFKINGTSRGNNVLALTDTTDLNNGTAEGTVATWTTIDNTTEGYVGIDITGNGSDEYYYSEWNVDTSNHSINDFYERMKWLTRDGSVSTLYGLNGELFRGITHQIPVDGASGTMCAVEAVSWTGGTGQMLAIDSTTAATKIWIQILTGTAPSDDDVITGGTSSNTVTTNGTFTERPISTPFVGNSTGAAIIGAYGLGIESTDVGSADKLFDLDNAQQTPPNNVTFTVFGLYTGEDRVLVTNDDAGNIDYNQMTLGTTLSGTSETTVNVGTGNIPADTPSTGNLRIQLDDGRYRLVPYTAHDGDDGFTIASTDFSSPDDATAGNNIFLSYIDKLATTNNETFTTVYNADRTLFIRVRDGGASPIKTFETTGTLGSTGGSATAIRTSDA